MICRNCGKAIISGVEPFHRAPSGAVSHAECPTLTEPLHTGPDTPEMVEKKFRRIRNALRGMKVTGAERGQGNTVRVTFDMKDHPIKICGNMLDLVECITGDKTL